MFENMPVLNKWTELFAAFGTWQYIIAAAAAFLFFLLTRGFFTGIIFRFLLGFAKKTRTDLDNNLLAAFQNPVKSLFIVVGVYFALLILPLKAEVYLVLSPIYRTLVIFFVAQGFYLVADKNNYLELHEKYGVDLTLLNFFSKIVRVLIVVLALLMVIQTWGYNVGGFLAGLGLGGLAIALAAQDTAANVFGGIMIILDNPFSVGDWIETPEVEGTVEEISFRSTKVRTFAQALVTVPNSVLAGKAVTNWSRMGKRRVVFHLSIKYSTPPEKLKQCMEKIRSMLQNHPEVDQETLYVNFDRFGDSSLDILVYFFTKTTVWGEYLAVKEDVNIKIMEILSGEGVEFAYPSRAVYLENTGPSS